MIISGIVYDSSEKDTEGIILALKIPSLFKKTGPKEEPKVEEKKEPVIEVKEPTSKKAPIRKAASKKAPVKKTPAKKTETKKAPAKKTETKKAPAKKTETKKSTEKRPAAKKTTAKPIVKKVPAEQVPGTMPPELKGFERKLKMYIEHSRVAFDSKNSNRVFTEYMAKVFRDLGYKMVLIRDADAGAITMLDRDTGNDVIKDKIIVKCCYRKKGSIDADAVMEAQENGAHFRGDETWCITTTDFTEDAIKKSKKRDAKVKLFDGKRLHKDLLSKTERE